MTTTFVAFFMSRLCKQRRRSQQEKKSGVVLRSSGVLTGRSLQAMRGLAGEIMSRPPLAEFLHHAEEEE